MTPTDLAELERLEREATPGPWKPCKHLRSADDDASCPCGFRGDIWDGDEERVICEMETRGELAPPHPVRAETIANAQLIVALRNNASTLITLARLGMAARDFLEEHGRQLLSIPNVDCLTTDEQRDAKDALESLLKEARR